MRRYLPAAAAALTVILTVIITQSFVFKAPVPETIATEDEPRLVRIDVSDYNGPDRPMCGSAHRTALTLAFATVESGCDEAAVGPTDDLGWLQITPVLVEDCNRILRRTEFTLEDRLDRERSEQMFRIIQDHYNPSWDLTAAARRWNPGADKAYRDKVAKAYSDISARCLDKLR